MFIGKNNLKYINNEEIYQVYEFGRHNIATISILPKLLYTFNTTPIKILLGDVTEIYATS